MHSAWIKTSPELLEQVNAFIAKIQEDGTFNEICDKYFSDGEPAAVESAEYDASKDQLVVATNASFEPFEYVDGDSYKGIDMEIAALFAQELGKELVIENMDFDAVCLSVWSAQMRHRNGRLNDQRGERRICNFLRSVL